LEAASLELSSRVLRKNSVNLWRARERWMRAARDRYPQRIAEISNEYDDNVRHVAIPGRTLAKDIAMRIEDVPNSVVKLRH